MSPCLYCEKEGQQYIINSKQSSYYTKCVYCKRSYNSLVNSQDKNVHCKNNQVAIEYQENALEEEEERAAAQA